MKIVRVDSEVDDITYGAVEPEGIRLHRGSPFIAWEPTETVVAWDKARLLAPVIPTKVIAVGRNYEDHAAEMGHEVPESPMIFLKPPTSVIGPLAPIRIPDGVGEIHHEAELAVVIGTVTRDVRVEVQGIRHVLSARSRHRHGARPPGESLDRVPRQRRHAPGGDDVGHGLRCGRARLVHLASDDAPPR